MISEPALSDRVEQPYVGIRTQARLGDLGTGLIPQLHDEVLDWLKRQGRVPAGPPFIRYHVIDMEALLDMTLGWPVERSLQGDERVIADVLPAGRYASLIYTGVMNGVQATKVLIDWATQRGIVWDRWDTPHGDAFAGRYESYLTDPSAELDPTKWQTEIGIRVADR